MPVETSPPHCPTGFGRWGDHPMKLVPTYGLDVFSCHPTNHVKCQRTEANTIQPGIERVQALAYISRSALSCHSNETCAPIANPPNSAQLEGTPTIPPSYIRVRALVCECGERQTQTCVTNIHFASATPHAKCNDSNQWPGLLLSLSATRLLTEVALLPFY